MTRHLHLPHPHIADLFVEHVGEGIFAGLLHHSAHPAPPRAVPAAEDWNDWHHAPARAEWEDER